MVRRVFDLELVLARQRAAAEVIAKLSNVTLEPLPHFYRVDYSVSVNRSVVAVAVIRCRDIPSDTYRETYISTSKLLKANEFLSLGLRVVIFFAFLDGIFRYEFKGGQLDACLGGRTVRDDKETVELLSMIPNEDMEKVSGVNVFATVRGV